MLAAALQAIARHGPEATMDDIAAEASVSKPIVYRMLGDRATLSVALSEWLIDRIEEATNAAGAGMPTPRQHFRRGIGAFLSTVNEHRNVFQFVNGAQPTAVYQRLVERSARPLLTLMRGLRTAAGLDSDGAHTWAFAVIGALQTVAIMSQRARTLDVEAVSDDLTRLLWDGLGAAWPTLPSRPGFDRDT